MSVINVQLQAFSHQTRKDAPWKLNGKGLIDQDLLFSKYFVPVHGEISHKNYLVIFDPSIQDSN